MKRGTMSFRISLRNLLIGLAVAASAGTLGVVATPAAPANAAIVTPYVAKASSGWTCTLTSSDCGYFEVIVASRITNPYPYASPWVRQVLSVQVVGRGGKVLSGTLTMSGTRGTCSMNMGQGTRTFSNCYGNSKYATFTYKGTIDLFWYNPTRTVSNVPLFDR